MDTVSIILVIAASIGSFWGGRKSSRSDLLEMLQAEVEFLKQKNEEKDETIAELQGKLGVLESLITQRAEVSAVHEEVLAVKSIVQGIADHYGIRP